MVDLDMRYDPKLDGIRAFAAISVVFFHSNVPCFHGGFIGVDVFFVLSGYLITKVLQDCPDLPRFYIHRIKRLIPPLTFMLAVYLLVFPILVPGYPHARDAGLSFFYLSDYGVSFFDLPKYLRHTWSLSVEEHFYLLWPLIFLTFKPPVRVLIAAYVIATLWRWSCTPSGIVETYHRFDTRMSGLILGCILGLISIPRISAWPGMIALAAACLLIRIDFNYLRYGAIFVDMAAAVLIIGVKPKWLGSAPIAYLGKLSYGIYLWHYPIVCICRNLELPWYTTAAVSLSASIGFSALSYHFVERWFRRRRGQRVSEVAAIT